MVNYQHELYEKECTISIYYNGDEEIVKTFDKYAEFIKNETLGINIIKENDLKDVCDINEKQMFIKIEKA